MTPADEDTLWRNRFITINMVRIGGTAVVLLALLIWHTDMIVPRGSMVLGLPLALAGLVVSFLGPRYLARRWRSQDGR